MGTYPGISSDSFRHPLDREAEQALRNIPGFELVARKFIEFVYERPRFIYLMGNAIQVGSRQYANLYHIFRDCVRDLDVSPEPSLFISHDPFANANSLGQERPVVVLNSGLLDLLDEDELRVVFAHELGHIKCGHTTLNQMAIWAIRAVSGLASMTMGLSSFISTALLAGFYEWARKAELSADRAALLLSDDPKPVLRTMMKMTGGSVRYGHEVSLDEFLAQAKRYQELDQEGINQAYKFLLYNDVANRIFLTHPFTVERVHYLQEWAGSSDYHQIQTGHYLRRTDGGSADIPVQSSSQSDNGDVDLLRREVAALQEEINRIRNQRGDHD